MNVVQSQPTDDLQAQKARKAGWKVDFPPVSICTACTTPQECRATGWCAARTDA